jgi:hypothetical protein
MPVGDVVVVVVVVVVLLMHCKLAMDLCGALQ